MPLNATGFDDVEVGCSTPNNRCKECIGQACQTEAIDHIGKCPKMSRIVFADVFSQLSDICKRSFNIS